MALAQCSREGAVERDPSTLTIHVADSDERAMGPLGLKWFPVFLGLTDDQDRTGQPQSRLLERWEHTPDYTEWTVHLREGVLWNDGEPVTAEDVKFSLELWTDEEVLYENPWFDHITVLGTHSLKLTFVEPVGGTLFSFNWLPMLPKHLLENLAPEEIFSWPFWVQPVGNGPFRYVRHVPQTMTQLEANPDYFGEAPRIPRVVLRYGGNRLVELLSGNVDVVSGLTPLDAVQLSSDPRFRIYHRIRYPQDIAIVWNHRNSLFSDPDVRRALTMSIDRRELHRLLSYPDDLPIFDVPALARHHLQGVVPAGLPFDPAGAAALLERAGWVDTDGDDILEKDGQEFRFTLSTTANETTEAVYLQDRFRRAGIRMEIGTFDRDALRERTDRMFDFDAAIVYYNYIENFGEFRRSGYENANASRLRDGAWFTVDPETADRNLFEREIFEQEIPVTYLHHRIEYLAAHRRVQGLRNNRDLFSIVEHLWIDEDENEGGR
jgi:peptide/nickel transport system substrate-binding protein